MKQPETITVSWDDTLANNLGIRHIYYISPLTGRTTYMGLHKAGSIRIAKGSSIVISFHHMDPEVTSELRLFNENGALLDEGMGMVNNDILLFYTPKGNTELKMKYDDYKEEYYTYTWEIQCIRQIE